MPRAVALLLVIGLAAGGCGSVTDPDAFPKPAEPAHALPLTRPPAGHTLRVGARPEGVVADPRTGIVAVALHDPDEIALVDGRAGRLLRRASATAAARQLAPARGGEGVLREGRWIAVVSARERVLELYDARTLRRIGRAPAGIGPTHVASDAHGLIYVVDTGGDSLLVFRTSPELQLTRRVYLPGAPYGVAYDERRQRLWVTASRTNVLYELRARGRPAVRRTFAAVRQPDAVAVDGATGRVFVTGRLDGVLQLLDPGD